MSVADAVRVERVSIDEDYYIKLLQTVLADDDHTEIFSPDNSDEPILASLATLVWEDFNGDGIRQKHESARGVKNVKLTLTGGGADGVIGTGGDDTSVVLFTNGCAVHRQHGRNMFTGLNPGEEYQVTFELPNGYEFTKQHAGSDGRVDSDAHPETGTTQIVTLSAGEFNTELEAGIVRVVYAKPILILIDYPTIIDDAHSHVHFPYTLVLNGSTTTAIDSYVIFGSDGGDRLSLRAITGSFDTTSFGNVTANDADVGVFQLSTDEATNIAIPPQVYTPNGGRGLERSVQLGANVDASSRAPNADLSRALGLFRLKYQHPPNLSASDQPFNAVWQDWEISRTPIKTNVEPTNKNNSFESETDSDRDDENSGPTNTERGPQKGDNGAAPQSLREKMDANTGRKKQRQQDVGPQDTEDAPRERSRSAGPSDQSGQEPDKNEGSCTDTWDEPSEQRTSAAVGSRDVGVMRTISSEMSDLMTGPNAALDLQGDPSAIAEPSAAVGDHVGFQAAAMAAGVVGTVVIGRRKNVDERGVV